MNRITQLSGLLTKENTAAKDHIELKPKYKHNWFKENGWGFKDTEFSLTKEGQILLTGSRYLFSGQVLPHFRPWAEKVLGLDLNAQTPAQAEMPVDPPILNKEFLDAIKPHVDEISSEKSQRIMHSHGHSMQEIFDIRHRKMVRTVDVVVYINSHEQAEKLVKFAVEHNVCLIPYGGGTNVTHALVPLQEEKRMIVSVDVTRMNHVKWVDRKNMKACVEAGIIGKDLERELGLYGLVLGHEPDSVEFSSLGGWVSTRASGMKKNVYGNIEDIVMQVKVATPIGTVVKLGDAPRISSGPDIDEIVMGSEGTIGIITEVILKVRETPPVKEYHSLIFHDFETGTKFMHDVAKSRIWPASIRLVDNTQFQFALSIRPEEHGFFKDIKDKLKKVYLEKIAGLDLTKIAVCTIVFEGSKESTEMQKKSIDALGAKYHGLSAGKEAGERGYFLTFMIAYLRDYGFNYSYIAESFETSVAWTQVITMCKATEQRIIDECKKRGVKKAPWISFRVTQVYDTGAAVYVYFGFHYGGLKDPVRVYSEIEDCAREEVMKNGGSISHHHGVGKLRKIFLKDSIGDTGLTVLKGVKKTFDPTNIFANGNLV